MKIQIQIHISPNYKIPLKMYQSVKEKTLIAPREQVPMTRKTEIAKRKTANLELRIISHSFNLMTTTDQLL